MRKLILLSTNCGRLTEENPRRVEMIMTFEQLLKGQSYNNIVDIYNETCDTIEDQKMHYPNEHLVLDSFCKRKDILEAELKRRREGK